MISCESEKVFEYSFFAKHLRVNASVLDNINI